MVENASFAPDREHVPLFLFERDTFTPQVDRLGAVPEPGFERVQGAEANKQTKNANATSNAKPYQTKRRSETNHEE